MALQRIDQSLFLSPRLPRIRTEHGGLKQAGKKARWTVVEDPGMNAGIIDTRSDCRAGQ